MEYLTKVYNSDNKVTMRTGCGEILSSEMSKLFRYRVNSFNLSNVFRIENSTISKIIPSYFI